MQNGKGDSPRNCFSKEFRENFDKIEWREKGTYCEYCSCDLGFPKDEEKHLEKQLNGVNMWVCSPGRECNFN